jgi:uncharacterized protein DUF3307
VTSQSDLFLLLVGHAVADFGLQSDWMAQNKRTSRIVRFMHSLIHGGATCLVLGVGYGIAETAAHYLIDSVTIKGKRPSLFVDQFLHVACKIAYWSMSR